MFPSTRLLTRTIPHSVRAFSSIKASGKWEGRQPEEHVTRTEDKHNIQKDASESGKEERAQGGGSQATSEGDHGNMNEKAKKDHPEAPGPVLGMNDERGGVSSPP